MTRRIILSPDAEADIRSSYRWYQRRETDAAERFKAEIKLILDRIARRPFEFPRVNDVVRRALVARFPYALYFTPHRNCVFVIAVLHQRRAETLWSDRPFH
jgi:plasmid stabilization system protein ParE